MSQPTRRGLLAAGGLAVAGLVASCARTPTDSRLAQTAWADLEHRLHGSLVRPGDAEYAKLASPRNLRFAATMPQAVVLCADVEDVAAAVQWARKTGTPFAIRGGGHNYIDASSSRGIVISMRRMNSVRLDGTRLLAQAGVCNADLAAVLPQGGTGRLLLPGGICPAVGVVGLTLGGGIGPNAPWAGLTADCLRAVSMVTAGGTVVRASATENPDLFWALRGGTGGNFGIVADLGYTLVEIPVTRATTAEISVAGEEATAAAGLAFQQMCREAGRVAIGALTATRAGMDVEARLQIQILTGEHGAHDLLGPLLKIPGARAEITERPWWDAYAWYVAPPWPAYSFWDRSLYADAYLSEDALVAAFDVVRRFPVNGDRDREGALTLFGWVGGAVSEIGPHSTAYVHRSARVLVEISTGWATPAKPASPVTPIPGDIRAWVEQLWEVVLPHTTGRSYQNFPDPELSDWADAYYGENLVRLKAVKAAWDPDGVFRYSQAVPLPR